MERQGCFALPLVLDWQHSTQRRAGTRSGARYRPVVGRWAQWCAWARLWLGLQFA